MASQTGNELWTIVLREVDTGKNMLSSLMNDKKIVKDPEDVDYLISELCKMAALSLVKLEPIEDYEEKDLQIAITDLGKTYLKYVQITPKMS